MTTYILEIHTSGENYVALAVVSGLHGAEEYNPATRAAKWTFKKGVGKSDNGYRLRPVSHYDNDLDY